jgi:hypothetical protein
MSVAEVVEMALEPVGVGMAWDPGVCVKAAELGLAHARWLYSEHPVVAVSGPWHLRETS